MTITEATTDLSTLLSDTLQQVSVDRLNSAMSKAWNDPYVTSEVHNETLVYDSSVYEYTIPTGVTVIDSISVKFSSTDTPQPISAELWEIRNNKLYFTNYANSHISTGNIIVINGKYKLSQTDEIPDNSVLADYVVSLAAWIVLKQMGFTKVLSFLHNDTSMNELIGFRREVERDIKTLRSQLQTSYMDN